MKKSVVRTYCDSCHGEVEENSPFCNTPVYYKGLTGRIDLCGECVSRAVMSYYEDDIYKHLMAEGAAEVAATSAATSTSDVPMSRTDKVSEDPLVHRYFAIMREHF